VSDYTSVGVFLDKLRDRLSERSGLRGVAIYSGPVDDLSIGQEAIVFAVEPFTADFSYRTLPALEVFEEYPVEGRIWVVKAGGGEAIIKAARDRTIELFAEVCAELADDNASTPDTQAALGVDDARVATWTLTQFVIDGGRDCRLTFKIDVSARFTPE
jgi:hypothetical protein